MSVTVIPVNIVYTITPNIYKFKYYVGLGVGIEDRTKEL